MSPRYIILANPDSLRWRAYEPELRAYWREQGIEPDITLVPWRDLLARQGSLDTLPAFDRPAIVRLESPGRDWDVTRLLLRLGSDVENDETETDWLHLDHQFGRLVRPGLFYAGFRHLLQQLHTAFVARPHLRMTRCPLEIAEMFDKNQTSARLAAAGIPVPPSLAAPATPAALIDLVRQHGFQPAYAKVNSGSSASAIAVLRTGAAPSAVSSICVRGSDLFSTRRLETHTGDRLMAVLAFLLREGVCVQQGIRMAQLEGQNFDVRVIVIQGRPAFTLFRLSSNPMTNLHLGGRRGDLAVCRAAIPPRAWLDALDHCVETAKQYPRSDAIGVDLLFEQGYRRHFILEVNAFGDFFPNLTDEHGRSVYRVEIASHV